MSVVPGAAELASLRAAKADWMQTPVICCTTTSTKTSGGAVEVITEGATVYGRLYNRTAVQIIAGIGAGNGALATIRESYLEVPIDTPITVHVRIGGRDWEVGAQANSDDHTRLCDVYHIGRLGLPT